MVAILVVGHAAGCSICPSPYDYDYAAFGTKTPRADMRNGRVGSIFSDPGVDGYAVHASHTGSTTPQHDEVILEEEVLDGDVTIVDGIEIGEPR